MALVPLVPGTINAVITIGNAQQYQSSIINSLAGTPVDLSAWVSLTAKLSPAVPSPTGSEATFGTVTGATGGVLKLTVAAADLASTSPGSARLIISGKPTSGDDIQLLSTGVATVNAG